MKTVKISTTTLRGGHMTATFAPDKGMNLISLTYNDLELMDQTTSVLFYQRCAGLGALIGPHFHHRPNATIPETANNNLFPHFQLLRDQGVHEPFSHGIARYVPWTIYGLSETAVYAAVSGKDTWQGVPLADLEGRHFTMDFRATMGIMGLTIDLSVIADQPSVVGFHYYYALPDHKGTITAKVQDHMNDQGVLKPLLRQATYDANKIMTIPLTGAYDYGFKPHPHPSMGTIQLATSNYNLHLDYNSATEENSWQLYHPQGSSYVCIEPLSASDPRKPKLTVSGVRLNIDVENIDATHDHA